MIHDSLQDALTRQIGSELGASHHYLAIAAYFGGRSLTEWEAFFLRQSEEERGHALRIVRYLIDNDVAIAIPEIPAMDDGFDDALAAVTSALESERRVSQQFDRMAGLAAEHGDHRTAQFLQWFINEQVEEEATMSALVDLVGSGINLFQAQQYLPAPHAAGAEGEAV